MAVVAAEVLESTPCESTRSPAESAPGPGGVLHDRQAVAPKRSTRASTKVPRWAGVRRWAEPGHGDTQNWSLHTKPGLQSVAASLHRGTHLPA